MIVFAYRPITIAKLSLSPRVYIYKLLLLTRASSYRTEIVGLVQLSKALSTCDVDGTR